MDIIIEFILFLLLSIAGIAVGLLLDSDDDINGEWKKAIDISFVWLYIIDEHSTREEMRCFDGMDLTEMNFGGHSMESAIRTTGRCLLMLLSKSRTWVLYVLLSHSFAGGYPNVSRETCQYYRVKSPGYYAIIGA